MRSAPMSQMKIAGRLRTLWTVLVVSSVGQLGAQAPPAAVAPAPSAPLYPQLPSETPPTFVRPTAGADFVWRDVMIPMRDGVKLHTVILVPKGARQAGILLTRTPYE
ncbi:MAG: hypothetical protein JO341_14630, partial [Gammaproteobacteria bacterium]|nr:hypothetical protein [Gammaproteobacteria bacterium]